MVRRSPRQLLVALALSAAAAGVLLLCAPVLRDVALDLRAGGASAPRFEEALVGLCAACAALATLWCWLGAVSLALRPATGLAAAPTGPPLPLLLRRAVLVACGTALVAGAAGSPSGAVARSGHVVTAPRHDASSRQVAAPAPAPAPAPLEGPGTLAGRLAGLPLPDRAEGAARASSRSATPRAATVRRTSPAPSEVVVRPGDSLWHIAERLGPGSVEATWRALVEANADRLEDPDLIRPGQRLALPPTQEPPA